MKTALDTINAIVVNAGEPPLTSEEFAQIDSTLTREFHDFSRRGVYCQARTSHLVTIGNRVREIRAK